MKNILLNQKRGINSVKKYCWLGLIGAALYPLLEIAFRGFSHWSMSLAGGLCLILLAFVQKRLKKSGLHLRCLAGTAAITLVELACGCVVNLHLGLNVWNYSHMPGNVLGQICPLFCLLWFLLCIPVFCVLAKLESGAWRLVMA